MAKKKSRDENNSDLVQFKVEDERSPVETHRKQQSTPEDKIAPGEGRSTRIKCTIKYLQSWIKLSGDERDREDLCRVHYLSMAVSLCFLANKVEANAMEEVLSVLFKENFRSKTFKEHMADLEDLFTLRKKGTCSILPLKTKSSVGEAWPTLLGGRAFQMPRMPKEIWC